VSKSAGNVIAPQKIIDQFGAEVLRLWVASENYREDIRLSQEILKRLTEAYRKIRNTYRFLLGNLSDFDPQKDMVPHEQLMEIDRYILHRFKLLVDKIMKAYDEYEFHVFYQSFYSFCVVDLSAFYLDIIKDRLYTYPRTSRERRSGQTALYILLRDMTRLMAPILSFTAEEIWSYMPAGGVTEKSVHQSLFPDASELNLEDDVIRKWEMLVVLKGEVSKALEHCRREKVIGHSLDAVVQLVLPKNIRTLLNNDFEELKFIFIVSKVEVVDSLDNESGVTKSDVLEGVQVLPKPMGGQKCERCWNYFLEIVEGTEHTSICPRCIKNLQATVA
jgi:isoleucyl-tRNA synthetase